MFSDLALHNSKYLYSDLFRHSFRIYGNAYKVALSKYFKNTLTYMYLDLIIHCSKKNVFRFNSIVKNCMYLCLIVHGVKLIYKYVSLNSELG